MVSKINDIIPSTQENNIREFNETPTKPLVPIKGNEKVEANYLKLQSKQHIISHKTQVAFNNLFAELKQRYCFIDCDKCFFFFI